MGSLSLDNGSTRPYEALNDGYKGHRGFDCFFLIRGYISMPKWWWFGDGWSILEWNVLFYTLYIYIYLRCGYSNPVHSVSIHVSFCCKKTRWSNPIFTALPPDSTSGSVKNIGGDGTPWIERISRSWWLLGRWHVITAIQGYPMEIWQK